MVQKCLIALECSKWPKDSSYAAFRFWLCGYRRQITVVWFVTASHLLTFCGFASIQFSSHYPNGSLGLPLPLHWQMAHAFEKWQFTTKTSKTTGTWYEGCKSRLGSKARPGWKRAWKKNTLNNSRAVGWKLRWSPSKYGVLKRFIKMISKRC